MGKRMNDSGADAALDYWTNANKMVLCSSEPTTYTQANATYALADVAMTGGDFTKADDTSGRKVTVAAKSGVSVDNSGSGTHIALINTSDSSLRYVTTCPSTAVTAGGAVDIGSWKINIPDPS